MTWTRADLVGSRFGSLVVIAPDRKSPTTGKWHWLCRCDCGGTCTPLTGSLRSGNTRSCGCEARRNRATHGMEGTPTYVSWSSMRNRCLNPNGQDYRNYGGRNIAITPAWDRFENFLADMGERPEGTSLDRIDVNGNYEPGNCRWASPGVQFENRRPPEEWDAEARERFLANRREPRWLRG